MSRFAIASLLLRLFCLKVDCALGSLAALEVDSQGVEQNEVKRWGKFVSDSVPDACSPFEADFADKKIAFSQKDVVPDFKGQWHPCIHIKTYGLNFSPQFAKFLAHQLKPKSAMEFGCALGTTADYIARVTGADTTCIEPKQTHGRAGILVEHASVQQNLRQLAFDMFSKDKGEGRCAEKLKEQKVDLVFSLEVVEHLPWPTHQKLIQMLVAKTGKWLVFSGARPKQKAVGHLPQSMSTEVDWKGIFEKKGLQFMANLTKIARNSAYWYRGFDLFSNVLVFKNPNSTAEDTDEPVKELVNDFYAGVGDEEDGGKFSFWQRPSEYQRSKDLQDQMWKAQDDVTRAMWPELHEMVQGIRNSTLPCDSAETLFSAASAASSSSLVRRKSQWGSSSVWVR